MTSPRDRESEQLPKPVPVAQRLRAAGFAPPAPPSPWSPRAEAPRLRERLSRGARPDVVAVAGPTGIGKSALAAFVARQLEPDYPDGLVWIQANRLDDPELVLATQLHLADLLGFRAALPEPAMVARPQFDQAFRRELWRPGRFVVLDDVRRPEVVQHFVDDDVAVHALVTSHLPHLGDRLRAEPLALGGLPEEAALAILEGWVGGARLAGDWPGTRRLLAVLDGVPRHLHIAGRVLSREPATATGALAARITADPTPLATRDAPASPPAARGALASPSDADPGGSLLPFQHLRWVVSPAAWDLFAALSAFEDRPFSRSWAAAVSGLEPGACERHLRELVALFLVTDDDPARGPGPAEPRFHLDAEAARAARWAAGVERHARFQQRLLDHAAAEARRWARVGRAASLQAWRQHRDLWIFCLGLLSAEILPPGQGHHCGPPQPGDDAPSPPDAGRQLPDLCLLLIAADLPRRTWATGRWLNAGYRVARRQGRVDAMADIAHGLGWRAVGRLVFTASQPWFLRAADHDLGCGRAEQAVASLALSAFSLYPQARLDEARALLARAVDAARAADLRGPAVAAVVNQAALFEARCATELDGWRSARALLAEALGRCLGVTRAAAFMAATCRVNAAFCELRLDGRLAAPERTARDLATLDEALPESDLDRHRLAAMARWLGVAAPSARPLPSPGECVRQTPVTERVRMMMRFDELTRIGAMLAEHEATGAPLPPNASGELGLAELTLDLPIEREVGMIVAVLFPIGGLRYLLTEDYFALALPRARVALGEQHPLCGLIEAERDRRFGAPDGPLAPPAEPPGGG